MRDSRAFFTSREACHSCSRQMCTVLFQKKLWDPITGKWIIAGLQEKCRVVVVQTVAGDSGEAESPALKEVGPGLRQCSFLLCLSLLRVWKRQPRRSLMWLLYARPANLVISYLNKVGGPEHKKPQKGCFRV